MKIIFLNRYFYPDHSATSQLLSDLAFFLASEGREVHIITSRQRYDEPGARLPPREVVRGVAVRRVWTSRFGRGSLPGRALDYLTFYIGTALALMRLAARGDVIVTKTDPPLLSLVAYPVARMKGAKLINWLQDIFPEIAAAVGLNWAKGYAGRLLAGARDWTLRGAEANVVLGSEMERYLTTRGVHEARIRVIPNWADGKSVHPVAPQDNSLRRTWALDGEFVVGYSGNMGRVHEFETILGAAEGIGDKVIFLFIGSGAQRHWLEMQARKRGLPGVRFQPYQPRERLAETLSVPDVHLISLLPAVEGYVFPSKLYGILAAGRPVLFVGDPDGEIARIINEGQCGIAVRTGNASGLAAAIMQLKNDAALRRRYSDNARRLFEAQFDQPIAFAAWRAVLNV